MEPRRGPVDLLAVDRPRTRPALHEQLERDLRDAVRCGRVRAGRAAAVQPQLGIRARHLTRGRDGRLRAAGRRGLPGDPAGRTGPRGARDALADATAADAAAGCRGSHMTSARACPIWRASPVTGGCARSHRVAGRRIDAIGIRRSARCRRSCVTRSPITSSACEASRPRPSTCRLRGFSSGPVADLPLARRSGHRAHRARGPGWHAQRLSSRSRSEVAPIPVDA